MPTRTETCVSRLRVTDDIAELVCSRDVAACEAVLAEASARFQAHEAAIRSGDAAPCSCSPVDRNEWGYACDVLRIVWDARSYLELARAGAPIAGAYPCKCNGTGTFSWGGGTVNGVFTGKTGMCFGCRGKGWCSHLDRKRNDYYWAHIFRVSV